MSTIVLVHGAWHDKHCWAYVTAALDRRGVGWATLTLPSTDPGPDPPGFAADVGAVTDLLDTLDGDITLCGHSYGGMVVSEAGNHRRVTRLVYLAAACPLAGQSLLDRRAGTRWWVRAAIRRTAGGEAILAPHRAASLLYGDLGRELAAAKAAMLRPSSASILRATATDPAWVHKPTTYVVCRRDRLYSPRSARQIANRVIRNQIYRGRPALPAVTLPSGHCPFFSVPGLVADLLAGNGSPT